MNNSQQYINQIRSLFEEVYNKGNLSFCDNLFDSKLKINDPNASHKEGLKNFKEMETLYKKAFPNKKAKIDSISATDNEVIVCWTCNGTHKGEFRGLSPTNKEFKISGISIYHFTNGKVTEIRQVWDVLGLLEQLGAVHHLVHSR